VAQSAKRKRGYADKQDDKNKKSKAAGEKAKADFVLKMARGGKKQPDNGEDFVANAVANALVNMVGAEGYGEGSADAILDGVEEEDNRKPPAVVMGVEDLEESQLSTVQNPAPFPDPKPQALREEEYTTVGGMGVGNIPVTAPAAKVDKRKGRKDKKKRAGRTCKKCRRNRCLASEYCPGRASTGTCQFYIQVSENPVRDEAIYCKLCAEYGVYGVSCIGYDKLKNIRVCDKYDDDGTPKQSN
jgi:hypothetical protein